MYAEAHPSSREQPKRQLSHAALRAAGGTLATLLAAVAICGGIGWLYLLRKTGTLTAGPVFHGALPLEELAGGAAQPLLRMATAWLPAGFAAGLALGYLTRLRAAAVVGSCGLIAALLLYALTAASEALIHNEHVVRHLAPALGRSGLWAAVILAVIGSLPAAAVAAAARRRPEAASTSADAPGAAGP